MDQQRFLRLAKRELDMSYPQLAAEIGVSPRTVEKWSLGDRSPDHRAMPLIACKFISRLLEEKKRSRVLAGDRGTAEVVDAIVAHVSANKLQAALRTFDTLQRAANTLVPMTLASDGPRYFKTLPEKNAWSEQEELRNARRVDKKSAPAR
jgi:transcriptional regulator with XRE-family HTH domain